MKYLIATATIISGFNFATPALASEEAAATSTATNPPPKRSWLDAPISAGMPWWAAAS